MPKRKGAPLPITYLSVVDPVDREIGYCPTKAPYDPRWMLEGRPNPTNPSVWESGFFDQGSWQVIVEGKTRIIDPLLSEKSNFYSVILFFESLTLDSCSATPKTR